MQQRLKNKIWPVALLAIGLSSLGYFVVPLFAKQTFTGWYYVNGKKSANIASLIPSSKVEGFKTEEECRKWGTNLRHEIDKINDVFLCAFNCQKTGFDQKIVCDPNKSFYYDFVK